jgi:uncharacterized protein YdeI (YjbR/CyaY-like superfamily)
MPKPKPKTPAVAEIDSVQPRSRAEWRKWLERNHTRTGPVWLVYAKKDSGLPSLGYDEAVEEALCFGWIDSKVNRLDARRYKQLFGPRKSGSTWSRLNKTRVERLIAEGLMTPAGMAKIEEARRDGSWETLDAVEDLTVPEDLDAALSANPVARRHFEAFPPSSRKNILWWIRSAKRPETRAKRVAEAVDLAARNLRANHYRQSGE